MICIGAPRPRAYALVAHKEYNRTVQLRFIGKARNIGARRQNPIWSTSNLARGLIFVLFFICLWYLPRAFSFCSAIMLLYPLTVTALCRERLLTRVGVPRNEYSEFLGFTMRGCGRLSRHRQTNSPSGLGGWLLCLSPTLPRGSCQEYRGINRQRVKKKKPAGEKNPSG